MTSPEQPNSQPETDDNDEKMLRIAQEAFNLSVGRATAPEVLERIESHEPEADNTQS